MVKTNIFLFIICMLFISCSTGTESEYQVLIKIEDENGKPFKPDRVYWYYPPSEQEETEEFETESINSDSTQFKVNSAESGRIYVAAKYRSDYSDDSYCWNSSYDAKPVNIEGNKMKEITLYMEIHTVCE